MTRKISTKKMWRVVYILDVDNRGEKSKFWGHENIFYVGQTSDIVARMKQHLTGQGSKFLQQRFRDARKKLVFMKWLYGSEFDAIDYERKIKNMSKGDKLGLICDGEFNDLICYKPFKFLTCRHYTGGGELLLKIGI